MDQSKFHYMIIRGEGMSSRQLDELWEKLHKLMRRLSLPAQWAQCGADRIYRILPEDFPEHKAQKFIRTEEGGPAFDPIDEVATEILDKLGDRAQWNSVNPFGGKYTQEQIDKIVDYDAIGIFLASSQDLDLEVVEILRKKGYTQDDVQEMMGERDRIVIVDEFKGRRGQRQLVYLIPLFKDIVCKNCSVGNHIARFVMTADGYERHQGCTQCQGTRFNLDILAEWAKAREYKEHLWRQLSNTEWELENIYQMRVRVKRALFPIRWKWEVRFSGAVRSALGNEGTLEEAKSRAEAHFLRLLEEEKTHE